MTRSCDEDPAFDYILALLVEAGEPLTVLPTHRVVGNLAGGGAGLIEGAGSLFDVRAGVTSEELIAASSRAGLAAGGQGSSANVAGLGRLIFTDYLLAFELSAALLMVAA